MAVLVLLLVLPLALHACPRLCSCPGSREVHCTFRHLASPPRNLPKDTERINLGYNSIQAVGVSEFADLQRLEMLMLHGNNIASVSAGAFYHLRSLQILKLSYNKLRTIYPSMFEGLSGLVRLHLDHNIIDFIEPLSFDGLTSLKLLQLEGNHLRDIHPHAFVTLSFLGNFWSSTLRHLHLADNQLEYLQPGTFQYVDKLEVLSIHGNPWSCDCQLHWLLEWNRKREGVIKCKKERDSGVIENCATCSSPQKLNGSQIFQLSPEQLSCEKPTLQSPLKQRESTSWEDTEPDLPYSKDLERPLGHLTFVLSDSHGNRAHVICIVTRPGEGTSMLWKTLKVPGQLSVNVTLMSSLECEIDREELQKLWRLIAYYYESPAILERGVRQDYNDSRATFQYSQAASEDSPYFTDLKGHLTAEPGWLLQPKVTIQLNRRKTTTKKLVLDFTTHISEHISGWGEQGTATFTWAMIKRGDPGRIQSVLEGSEVSLQCKLRSSGKQTVEWMLPDLSILSESHSRLKVSQDGILVIDKASLSDSGLYHCLVRTKTDIDIVSFRLTVRELLLSPNAINGKQMSVNSGESLSLPCSVSSVNPSMTVWYLPSNEILKPSPPKGRVYVSLNGTLTIKKATHEDAGEYSCLAANLYGADMLSHLVEIKGKRDSESPSVSEAREELTSGDILKSSKSSEDGEGEGSGYQEIKWPNPVQTPHRTGGRHNSSRGQFSYGNKGRRVKEGKRKPNKSVKELDPNRWAQILAKAHAKTPTHTLRKLNISNTQPPSTSTFPWSYLNRFPVWPSVQGSRQHPSTPGRAWSYLHPRGRDAGVTNRPEITALTAKPTTFIPASVSPAQGTTITLTLKPPHISSASRDFLLLSRLRNRYRQSQLDAYRLSQLGKIITPKPRINSPNPKPHQAPFSPKTHSPVTPTSLPLATSRPHSTPSILYGSRWHYSHWGPKKLSTALPFPNLMGNGVKPRITSVNVVSVSALAETDVFLPCESSGEPKPALSWTKVSTGATIQASTKHGQRFEVLENGTFVIKNVQLQDRGQYLCTAQNKFGSDRMVITLAVLTQPPKIVPPSSKDISLYLGKSVNLDCLAEGKPQAQISWILPDRTFVREVGLLNTAASLMPNGTLRIHAANFSSKGDYKCIASNAAGADTVTYRLHVAALPPSINEEASERIVIQPGRSVYVHCNSKGEPMPVLKWSLPGGVQIKPSQFLGARFFVFPNGTLYIKSVSSTDSGKYECSATNAVGSARREVQLDIKQEPSSPQRGLSQQHRVTAIYGSTVYLHCPESTNTQRGALWRLPSKTLLDYRYSPERSITAFPNGTLRILQLTEKDGGSYACMFQRPNGEDMELFQVEVLMKPPKIEHLGTAQTRVTYGENFQVDCVASGLPDPEVSWSLPDGTMINNALQSDDSGARSRRYVMFGNGTLLLQQMGKKDEGDYTCYAKNKLGEDEMKVSIRVVVDSPRILSKDQASLWGRLDEPVHMKCEARGDPPPTIIWLSPSNEIISSSSKYQILGDGTLVIRKVSVADRGKYACVARNSAGDDIKNVKLEVEAREPQINGQRGSTTVKGLVVSYQTMLLDCIAEGMPEPRITWTTPYGMSLPTPYLGGRFQVHRNGTLELRGLRKTDEGKFVCLAKNNLGEASLEIDLEVAPLAEKPSFLVPNIEVLPLKLDSSEVTLECHARGKPMPEFVWVLPNSTVLTPGTKLQRFLHYPVNGTLRIFQPVTSDKGVYRCLAKNVAGQAEKRYALEPGRKPQIRGTSGPMKISFGQSLNLPCSVDGWPQATISWTLPSGLILDKPQVVGRVTYLANGTLQLRETATFDRGTYICKATNTFGSSTLSYPVTVMVYPPRITNAPPSITKVNRGSPVKLSCVAAGIPKPDISWTLPGRTTLVPSNRFAAQGGVHMTVEGSLVIQNPVLMNSGIYKCNAKNALGTDFKATYLQVI
ncbi:matrix-remodeling-associated protein 5 [Megalops cyprinoides]|uniref:matrix-remodeling-associated protein 5 n=1 Tax=Megalops cyprinoides TaxID=118141 RepID=UPI0018651DD6|nr:matrix-remodeling-associated protein 5 [Megalops cyprinoides]